jgi:replicative DNA helicase
VGKSGFRVLALNEKSLKIEPAEVSRAFSTGVKPVHRLVTGLGREIRATGNHPFRSLSGWKRLDQLQAGDRVALQPIIATFASSDVYWDQIDAIEPAGEEEVFDLTVPTHSNFVVNNIIAHNSIEQDADVVLFIYREEMYNEETEKQNIADLIVAKHRNGPTGSVSLFFRKELTQFRDLELRREELE